MCTDKEGRGEKIEALIIQKCPIPAKRACNGTM